MIDAFGRRIEYLRISVTDRCNLRCAYCMPEPDYVWLPREELLSFEELADLACANQCRLLFIGFRLAAGADGSLESGNKSWLGASEQTTRSAQSVRGRCPRRRLCGVFRGLRR